MPLIVRHTFLPLFFCFVIKIIFIRNINRTHLIGLRINPQNTIGMTRQSIDYIPNHYAAQPFELAIQYHVTGIKFWSDGIHLVRFGVDAQHAFGMAGYAIYFGIGTFLSTEVEGRATECPFVGFATPLDGSFGRFVVLFFVEFRVVGAIVVLLVAMSGGVEVVEIGAALGSMGNSTWWHRCHDWIVGLPRDSLSLHALMNTPRFCCQRLPSWMAGCWFQLMCQ
mmetsp:Transcript_43842/g.92192  ORF Transcript_43842/g.92192 Transcript_43842/m.92192 type:complete len:223 (-) Transcript_43842:2-670(-)